MLLVLLVLLVLLALLVVERAFWVVVELLDDLRWVLDGRERLVVGIVLFTNREAIAIRE